MAWESCDVLPGWHKALVGVNQEWNGDASSLSIALLYIYFYGWQRVRALQLHLRWKVARPKTGTPPRAYFMVISSNYPPFTPFCRPLTPSSSPPPLLPQAWDGSRGPRASSLSTSGPLYTCSRRPSGPPASPRCTCKSTRVSFRSGSPYLWPRSPTPLPSHAPLRLLSSKRKNSCEKYVSCRTLCVVVLTVCQRIWNWYKEERKKSKHRDLALPHSTPAPHVLDLSGKSRRKKRPYQLHQAFSILYWRPLDSPLRDEVEDLWTRRTEDSVHDILKPFLKETADAVTSTSQKLIFHMAVMRWKCSLLTSEELATVQDWIDNNQKLAEKTQALPWSMEAAEHGDDLLAENTYIQRYVAQIFFRE